MTVDVAAIEDLFYDPVFVFVGVWVFWYHFFCLLDCCGVFRSWFKEGDVENWVYPHCFRQFEAEIDLSNLFVDFERSYLLEVQFVVRAPCPDVFSEEVNLVPPF